MRPPRVDVNRVVPGLRHTGMGMVFGDRGIDWMRCVQRGRQTFGYCPDRLWPGVGGGSMLHSSSALSAASQPKARGKKRPLHVYVSGACATVV